MEPSGVERKLAAILAADVVGYSRLMGEDPEATLQTLTRYRELFASSLREYRGWLVNEAGDSILAEFASVVDAVACAVALQQELAHRNEALPERRRMQFRIGVNLGGVLVNEGQVYGDGVNIAARMESLAEPGGVCVSGKAYEEVNACRSRSTSWGRGRSRTSAIRRSRHRDIMSISPMRGPPWLRS